MAEYSGEEATTGGASHAAASTLRWWLLNSVSIACHDRLHLSMGWSSDVDLLWTGWVTLHEGISVVVGLAGVVDVDGFISLEILVGVGRGDARRWSGRSAAAGSSGRVFGGHTRGARRRNIAVGECWYIREGWNVALCVGIAIDVVYLGGLVQSTVLVDDNWLVAALPLRTTSSLGPLLSVAHRAVLGDGLANWLEERLELELKLLHTEVQVVVEESEQLLLHEVDFRSRESELGEVLIWSGLDTGIVGPVPILWRRVVDIFGSDDEAREKDAVCRALEAFCNRWKLLAKALEVEKSGHQCGHLDVGLLDERTNELLESRDLLRRLERTLKLGRS